MNTHPPKLVQRLKETDSLPYIAPITTTLAPAPYTMSIDDEIARLKSTLADVHVIKGDLTRIIGQRDRYKEALEKILQRSPNNYISNLANDALNAQ